MLMVDLFLDQLTYTVWSIDLILQDFEKRVHFEPKHWRKLAKKTHDLENLLNMNNINQERFSFKKILHPVLKKMLICIPNLVHP